MVEDLNMNIEIIGCPIIREVVGCMSSRNVYLSQEEEKLHIIITCFV